MSISFTDNINSFNVSNANVSIVSNYTITNDRSELLTWLSPLEPRIRHQDIRTRRADNVGRWLLETEEFRRWCDGAKQEGSEHTTLFCCGDPAVGKTYFTSLVVDKLCDMAGEQNMAVACFYVDFAARDEQSPTNMLGSLLKQIVGGLKRIPDEISQTFQNYKKVIGGRGLRVPEIVKMLQTVTSLRPTFLCVDALDECVEGHRPEVLDSLSQILEKSSNARIFLTGRRHIRGEIERHFSGGIAVLSIKPNNDDIVGYIRMRLSKDTSLDAMGDGLEAEIIKTVAENISETFLLISLTIDAILGEPTAHGRRRKLMAMANGLNLKSVYGTTLERIQELGGEKARLGMATLMWISHSERLLRLDELLHALAVEIGSTGLNSETIPTVETLLSCCLGLVVIDKEASIARLIHFTLQEHLYARPDLFIAAHSIMAETCLTYLNFGTINDISPSQFASPQSAPFLRYSSLYWGAHARREASQGVVSLALKLFSRIETHISTKLLLLDITASASRYNRDIPTNGHLIGFTGLHCASVFGITEITKTLMGQPNTDLNKRDFLGITPLIWAAICGREEVAKLLLERRTTIPDKPDKLFHRTALSWAAEKGHEGAVRVLLGRAYAKLVRPDSWWAGSPQVMGTILGKKYVNPNRPDKYGQTPISLASEEGHDEVVKLLLGRKDVRPNVADGYGRTPLLLASSKGRESVVKLLVDREDVNINMPDRNGETPLFSAVDCGYSGVVGILLGREDINLDMPGNGDWTPLLAAKKGYDGVVKLLLGREDVNPNIPYNDGSTPLSWAAWKGHNEVVKLLLGREDVDPNIPDNHGSTPLLWAARNGHTEVVKLLLRREDVGPSISDNDGRTPLSRAARKGHSEVVKLLLGREDVDPNISDNDGRTPLFCAARNGHSEVVKLLLGRKDVDPNIPYSDGSTPLLWAAWRGHSEVVQLLLGREDVEPNMSDNGGLTPLSWATRNGHNEVVKILLGQGDVNPNMSDNHGRAPLLWAAGDGHTEAVKLLLGREDLSSDIPDNNGRTPLEWASGNGHNEIVKILQAHKPVNPITS